MRLMRGVLRITSFLLLLIGSNSVNGSLSADLHAAMAFRDAMGGAISTAWTGNDFCIWPGIVCEPDTLRVTDIVLRAGDTSDTTLANQKLHWTGDWTGLISDSLCLLDQLTTLIVTDWGSISGEIPPCITSLSRLRFWTSGNRISGGIPTDIGKLSQLVVLNLADNEISGSIPASIVDLSSLKLLDISNNKLSGEVPSDIGKLKMLSRAIMGGNQLSGSMPTSIAALSRMADLDLSMNQISGSIPEQIGSMPVLSTLILYSNQLSGEIPASLFSNTGLSHLNLSRNSLEGKLPDSFSPIITIQCWIYPIIS
ncbi:UNVERIFIED_CONTAM: DNA damage-repair/toleration protein [Sesamum radiatum]|uniref:DNA damage-repair/toleration protein n=1 Tax=Sesamum radiatum TaxID=300843 RepID=A0AAW2VBD0_SESRA